MFKKLFRRGEKSTSSQDAGPPVTGNSKPPEASIPAEKAFSASADSTEEPLQAGQPVQGGQVYIPPAPHNSGQQSMAQNLGMTGGAVVAMETGGNMGMGMVEGMVVGGMINQRVQQHQKHQYWREQAVNYQAGLPAAGVGDPRVVTPMGDRERARAEGGRDEKRRKRWERRAKRKGIDVPGSA